MRLPWQRGGDEADDTVVRSATAARDEQLSEYLDGFSSRPDRAAIEADAARDSDVRLALEGMRAVRASLGELGMVRAPRSFAIAPQDAPRQFGLPRIELYMRFATVAAALVLTATTLAPSFTGGIEERSTGSMAESFDAAQSPTEARKQAADQAAPPPQATGAARAAAPVAAPALEGAPAAGGATQAAPAAPAVQPSSAAPPRTGAPASEGAASAPPVLPPVSEQPVPLSNGAADASSSAFWGAQFAAAVATAVFAAAALWLWLRRRTRNAV